MIICSAHDTPVAPYETRKTPERQACKETVRKEEGKGEKGKFIHSGRLDARQHARQETTQTVWKSDRKADGKRGRKISQYFKRKIIFSSRKVLNHRVYSPPPHLHLQHHLRFLPSRGQHR